MIALPGNDETIVCPVHHGIIADRSISGRNVSEIVKSTFSKHEASARENSKYRATNCARAPRRISSSWIMTYERSYRLADGTTLNS